MTIVVQLETINCILGKIIFSMTIIVLFKKAIFYAGRYFNYRPNKIGVISFGEDNFLTGVIVHKEIALFNRTIIAVGKLSLHVSEVSFLMKENSFLFSP